MEDLLRSTSLVQRAFWLVRLRWVAVGALAIATFVSHRFMHVALAEVSLYIVAGLTLLYNSVLCGWLRYGTRRGRELSDRRVGRMITLQMSADLLVLATILHFSGGIENPFSFFFVFHMILASILRSRWQSYAQATLGIALFGGVVILEAFGVLNHYPLENFAGHGLHDQPLFVLGFLFVFSMTLYSVVYMTSSISEQLRIQQAGYREANAQLQEKDQLKNEYVLRLTHDIKGHLAAIQSCLDIVLDGALGPLNDPQRDFVERADRRAVKCMAFITALLKLTRMKLTGRLDMERFSLKTCVMNAVTSVQNRAEVKAIEFSYHMDDSIGEIVGEAVLIEETIANILFNAVKYTPEGGKVSLEVADDGSFIRVTVSDTGIGIPAEALEHLFEEFYRAPNARANERDGTGLGLSFAKQVVERHGGRIWVRNNPDRGSTFGFTLPKPPWS